jgi:membrane protein
VEQVQPFRTVLHRVREQVSEERLTLVSAGTAFWILLSLFPGLIAVISLYGLVADPEQAADSIDQVLSGISPEAQEVIAAQVDNIAAASRNLSLSLVSSLVLALWSASAGVHNVMSAVTHAQGHEETRGWFRLKATALLITVIGIVVGATVIGVLGVLPALYDRLPEWAGWVSGVLTTLLVYVLLTATIAMVYRWSPPVAVTSWAIRLPGAMIASLVVIVGTIGFSFYARSFSSYGSVYGALAGVIIVMMLLFINVLIVLVGAVVNIERHHLGVARHERLLD